MTVNSRSYPHPVLGNEDDINGVFFGDLPYELSKEKIILNPYFTLENEAIEKLINQGKALIVTEVECANTFYRKSFTTNKLTERFEIPSKYLRERVAVGFYICATQKLSDYQPSSPHPDYKGAKFDLESGDILATGGSCNFIAEKDFDPLKPPVSSIIRIQDGQYHEGPMQIDYESDKITIILSKADWHNYCDVRKQKTTWGMLHAAIVFPVLIDAIHHVFTKDSDYQGKNWFGRLEAILEAKRLHDKDPYEAAQRILENPITRSFESINGVLFESNEQEYE